MPREQLRLTHNNSELWDVIIIDIKKATGEASETIKYTRLHSISRLGYKKVFISINTNNYTIPAKSIVNKPTETCYQFI